MTDQTRLHPAVREGLIILGVILLTLPFLAPFLHSQHPASGDGLLNMYRIVALDFSVKNGDFYPRFAPAFHFGFGGPNFNFYSPLSYYFPVAAHQLFDLSFPISFRLSIIVYALIAALGAFNLGRVWGASPVVTAVAYVYAPPLFSTWDRISQLMAYALLPWLLWALWRLAQNRTRLNYALVISLFVALLLAHNITALVSAVFVVAYVLFLAYHAEQRIPALASMAGALAAGVLLTTFFWLPALTEQEFVQLNLLDIERFDFRNNFVPLTQMFTPGEAISLGLPQLALGVLGLIVAGVNAKTKHWRSLLLLLAGCVAVSAFLATSASLWVWEAAPLLSIVLFPQRFMYVAGLFLALMAGVGATVVLSRFNGYIEAGAVAAFALVVTLYVLPVMTVGYLTEDELGEVETIRDLHDIERAGYLGATSNGEFLPAWVSERPHSWQLTDRFYTDDNIARLLENQSVSVQSQEWGLTSANLEIEVQEATTLRFEWLYFPGWQAEINGQPAEVYPIDAQGFTAVDVPQGQQSIAVVFGATPMRRAAVMISVVGLLLVAGALVWLPMERKNPAQLAVTLLPLFLTVIVIIAVTLLRTF